MNKSAEKDLVPELRFPDFKGRWRKTQLNKLGELVSGLTYSPSDVRDSGLLVLRSSNVQNGVITLEDNVYVTPNVKGSNLSKANDILICVRNGSKALIGKNALIPEGMPVCTHGAFMTVFRSPFAKFVFQLFQTNAYQKQVDADLGATINSINGRHFIKYEFYVPKQPEQQKIADCLSSLDELLIAHNQKLDALKAHKKGLMQQLFPAEGETVPKLRFPEFRGDGDWCFDDLGSKAKKVGSGITPRGGDKNYKSAGVPFVRSQNIGWGSLLLDNIAYIEEEVHQSFSGTEIKESDVLLNITGASIGRTAIADQRVTGGNVNQHVCIIRTKLKELHPVYLSQFILSPNGQLQIDSFQAGGNREGLNFAQIRSFSIPIPPNVEEQKKIADGLSSIDELITAQSQKIDALKTHKQGLMQQLFPVVNEVSV
ncbi:restriction endonuclease subunit S [Pseudoalteromonas sp. NEC-BIFX-2020_002]|uniref:restriction endonuclease subunit S n=1 Tax=Pseudoalteromonas sp. NEC-BIFX-2020_002 TaxID=2732353 RepID=UPI0014774AD1|nr:restriction endonuclease subunit S [Pseudoalteromonas sp. NEC-BIFX-2020_002]NNG43530.1 restriction endonuclease subunit S [Pseudoalteromonas sp. NEC-BIFX-2020_002]